ncbi:MAG TPA: glycosyltransferase [Candidatus Acidoferrum sp.]|nr:glycosyltransferase [Candidatus Acidoferrum sp.]
MYAMQRALRLVDLGILTIPIEKAHWIHAGCGNIAFIPVGANLPDPERAFSLKRRSASEAATVCAFSISPGFVGRDETELIARAARYASEKIGSLRLVVVGRNSKEAGRQLQQRLRGSLVQLTVHGILEGEEIVRVLGECHVLLFTRGQISSRRGSAIAGIACGLPVIAEQGSETGAPITEAGVVLLPEGARDEFGPALVRVLSDAAYRESLAERSRRAQERYFSWKVIAEQYVAALYGPSRNDTKKFES